MIACDSIISSQSAVTLISHLGYWQWRLPDIYTKQILFIGHAVSRFFFFTLTDYACWYSLFEPTTISTNSRVFMCVAREFEQLHRRPGANCIFIRPELLFFSREDVTTTPIEFHIERFLAFSLAPSACFFFFFFLARKRWLEYTNMLYILSPEHRAHVRLLINEGLHQRRGRCESRFYESCSYKNELKAEQLAIISDYSLIGRF